MLKVHVSALLPTGFGKISIHHTDKVAKLAVEKKIWFVRLNEIKIWDTLYDLLYGLLDGRFHMMRSVNIWTTLWHLFLDCILASKWLDRYHSWRIVPAEIKSNYILNNFCNNASKNQQDRNPGTCTDYYTNTLHDSQCSVSFQQAPAGAQMITLHYLGKVKVVSRCLVSSLLTAQKWEKSTFRSTFQKVCVTTLSSRSIEFWWIVNCARLLHLSPG